MVNYNYTILVLISAQGVLHTMTESLTLGRAKRATAGNRYAISCQYRDPPADSQYERAAGESTSARRRRLVQGGRRGR
jgi:hypothetical protein